MADFESVKIVSNIFIAFIGSGVLGLPYAFKRSGILEGVFVMSAVAYFSSKAMLLLIDCQHHVRGVMEGDSAAVEEASDEEPFIHTNGKAGKATAAASHPVTYSDVAQAALGHWGRVVVDSSLVCAQIGFCCGYLIFITENLSTAFNADVPKTHWLVVVLPPLFVLTLIPDLGKLAVFSLLAQVSNLLAFAVVFWFDFEHLHLAAVRRRTEVAIKGFPFFFCAAVYCFEGAGMVISLEQSLPPSRRPHFKRYLVATIVCITTLYISFGVGGYLSFGPETKDIITLNLTSADSGIDFALLVKTFLCISLFFSYPIMLFPVTRMLQRKLVPPSLSNVVGGTTHKIPVLIRLVLVLLSGFFVCVVPNFSDLMNIIGAVFGTMLALIMPALCHHSLFEKHLQRSEKLLDFALVFLGCLGCGLGLLEASYGDRWEEARNVVVVVAESAVEAEIQPMATLAAISEVAASS